MLNEKNVYFQKIRGDINDCLIKSTVNICVIIKLYTVEEKTITTDYYELSSDIVKNQAKIHNEY